MRKSMIKIFLMILIVSFFGCQKNNDNSHAKKLTAAQNQISHLLATTGVTQSVSFEQGEMPFKSSGKIYQNSKQLRMATDCDIPAISLINYNIKYLRSSCPNSYNYKIYFEFSLVLEGITAFDGFDGKYLTFSKNDGSYIAYGSNFTISQIASNGNTYTFRTSEVDLGTEYCDVKGFYLELWPTWVCNGSTISTEVWLNYLNSLSTFDRCKTASPVFINARTSTTVDYSGWVTLCSPSPCNFLATDQFEFQYRPQGGSSWTTLVNDYYDGPFTISGLSSGVTYEYRHRNKMNTSITGTTAPCYGPYSAIKTF